MFIPEPEMTKYARHDIHGSVAETIQSNGDSEFI